MPSRLGTCRVQHVRRRRTGSIGIERILVERSQHTDYILHTRRSSYKFVFETVERTGKYLSV